MASATLLLKHADLLCTMEDDPASRAAGAEIRDGALFARDGVIVAVGPTAELPQDADRVIDMTGQLVIPGMVNTHHHLFQNYSLKFVLLTILQNSSYLHDLVLV